jgi:hypothetical protein
MVVKQIRLKDETIKVEYCDSCPCVNNYNGFSCPLLNKPVEGDKLGKDCPLEDYDDTKTDLGFI